MPFLSKMASSAWDAAHAQQFELVWAALNKAKLLAPAKLSWLSDEDITAVIKMALKEDAHYEDDDLGAALRRWLMEERDAAVKIQLSEGPACLREWQLDRYAFSVEQERRKKARIEEKAIE